MELTTELRKRKSFDIVVRKWENDIASETRTIALYGEEDKSVDDMAGWVKKKLGL